MLDDVEAPENTLRDTLEQAFDEHVNPDEPVTAPVHQPASEAVKPAADATAATNDTRARGPDGKFVEKSKDATAKPQQAAKPAADAPALDQSAVPAAPAVQPLARPSSWKKDLEPQWKALPPDVQKYVLQREGEFASGVSTYKREWDTAKPLVDAIAPYKQIFEQYKVDPAGHVSELLRIHHSLVTGSVQEKLGIVARIIQEQRLPLDQLFQQGQDGKLYFNQQLSQLAPQRQQQQAQPDVRKTVQEILLQERAQQSLAAFEESAPDHYETVKAEMAQLLESGLANDLQSAYDTAIRLPQHSDIFNAIQEQERAAKDSEKARVAAEAAQRARRNTVSPRSATPAGKPQGDKKGLRATLEDAFDEHQASRV